MRRRREKKENIDIAQFQLSKGCNNRGSRRTASGIAATASDSASSVSGGFSCSCTRFTFIASSGLNSFFEPNHAFEGVKENVESEGAWNEAHAEKKPMNNNKGCIYSSPSIYDFYTILDVIGSGTTGVVRLGRHKEVRKDLSLPP